MTLAADFSYARPSPRAIKAAGYEGVFRYLSGGTPGKDITAEEAAGYLEAGLWIVLIWETTAQRALAGASAGTVDGVAALQQARQVGYPPGCDLYVNVGDWAVQPGQTGAVVAYLQAFDQIVSSGGDHPGGYGTSYIIDAAAAAGVNDGWWQNAMDDNGQPGSMVDSKASVYQRVTPTRSIAGLAPGDWDEDVIPSTAEIRPWGNVSDQPATPASSQKKARMFLVSCNGTIWLVGTDNSRVEIVDTNEPIAAAIGATQVFPVSAEQLAKWPVKTAA